jgi:hypothetical protein
MTDRYGSLPASSSVKPSAPHRILWWLALLVLLGHWLLLTAIPLDVQVGPATEPLNPKTLVFNTRRIELPPTRGGRSGRAGSTQSRAVSKTKTSAAHHR